MLIKTKILLNVFQEEIDSITFEESEIDRLIKGMDSDEYYNTSESKIISKEFKECIISLDTGTILVKKGDKKIIYLYHQYHKFYDLNHLLFQQVHLRVQLGVHNYLNHA